VSSPFESCEFNKRLHKAAMAIDPTASTEIAILGRFIEKRGASNKTNAVNNGNKGTASNRFDTYW